MEVRAEGKTKISGSQDRTFENDWALHESETDRKKQDFKPEIKAVNETGYQASANSIKIKKYFCFYKEINELKILLCLKQGL